MIKLATKNYEQNWRANVDRPIFARAKTLMITELKIANLFCLGVCQEAPDVMLSGFFAFPVSSLVASWKLIEHPSSFVASCQPHSVFPVKFHNHKDSVIRATGILWVPTMCSRDIHSAEGQGGSPWSYPLRSDSSYNDQAGEVGPVEL